MFFYAFDLLHLNGKDFMRVPLAERLQRLGELITNPPAHVRFSPKLEGDPVDLIAAVRAQGLEGIVAKDRNSVYEPGKRTGKWQKFKLLLEEELLICGFIPDEKRGVESVVFGKKENRELPLRGMSGAVSALESKAGSGSETGSKKTCPFDEIHDREKGNSWSGGMTSEQKATAVWVQPKYKAEVSFLEWTRGGFLRHAQVKQLLIS